ncbi:hypothetical protein CLV84_1015 [Neolewinella xylanilytica]|uniref:Catechol 2,3-dioxygenase-like lactoylglutathione lyase family enzyme n=1 Tax=Neolewinella xylanilytica TaxID=1514080 RepID=A0A2S6I9A1_9BACT|nr:glyoxalase [Neolewinella xylanilytica]PPK88052.1 hypothetical protein CLV84_1015 [Neolewinella xylanilytica]
MQCISKSIRTFIGARDYGESRRFYARLGFEEVIIDRKMSYFKVRGSLGFYLQDYYEKSWVENTMLLLEVENFDNCYRELMALDLPKDYPGVRFSEVRREDWGRELHMHDPAGVLWHFAEFRTN